MRYVVQLVAIATGSRKYQKTTLASNPKRDYPQIWRSRDWLHDQMFIHHIKRGPCWLSKNTCLCPVTIQASTKAVWKWKLYMAKCQTRSAFEKLIFVQYTNDVPSFDWFCLYYRNFTNDVSNIWFWAIIFSSIPI
jgi:hypothetical protein